MAGPFQIERMTSAIRSTEPIKPWSPLGIETNREPGARRPDASQPLPGFLDAGEGDTFVLLAHDRDDRLRRRIPVDAVSALLEEPALDLELPPLPVVEEPDRIARRQLLDPAPAEAEGGSHQDQRGREGSLPGRRQRYQSPQRAPDDDLGPLRHGGPNRLGNDPSKSSFRTRAD